MNVLKRAFDLVLASLGVFVIAPLFLAVSIVILVLDGTPIFFRQTRVGCRGADFAMLKFRTMTVSSSARHGTFEPGSTARVTRVGRLLRRTKLDELPQLINVVKGDMSLVGPRPEIRKWVDAYPERWIKVHSVKPGITDPASVRFRNEEGLLAMADDPMVFYRDVVLPQKLDLYENYVSERSFFGDLEILIQTFKALFRKSV